MKYFLYLLMMPTVILFANGEESFQDILQKSSESENQGRYLFHPTIIIKNINNTSRGKNPETLDLSQIKLNFINIESKGHYIYLDYVNRDVVGTYKFKKVPALPSKKEILELKSKKDLELILGKPFTNPKYNFSMWGFFTITSKKLNIMHITCFYENDLVVSTGIGEGWTSR